MEAVQTLPYKSMVFPDDFFTFANLTGLLHRRKEASIQRTATPSENFQNRIQPQFKVSCYHNLLQTIIKETDVRLHKPGVASLRNKYRKKAQTPMHSSRMRKSQPVIYNYRMAD